jgi:HPr kinase/phosphorylase
MVNFVRWEQKSNYDRIGLEDEETEILGVRLPKLTIPVAPARNLAIILEVAAMNNRQKKLGHNTAQEFLKRHDQNIDSGGDCEEDSFEW